ncbi:unnamed protein product, partial [marine sediment metagenome]
IFNPQVVGMPHYVAVQPSSGNYFGNICVIPAGTGITSELALGNESNFEASSWLVMAILGSELAYIRFEGDETPTILEFHMHMYPGDDNTYSLGGDGNRFSDIWAVNTHWGDLGFAEKTCPKCGELFEVGDEIILKVIRFDERDEGIMTIPMHFACARRPPKTIKRSIPQFTTEYAFVEGEVVEVRVPLKQKRVITRGAIRNGYGFNKSTGTFSKNKVMKEGYNRTRVGQYIERGEVRDGYSYDPETKEYNNLRGELGTPATEIGLPSRALEWS